MTRSYERQEFYLPPRRDGHVRYMEEYEEYLAKRYEESPNNELVVEIPEDFDIKKHGRLNERSSR